jgi:hypothetical protein
MELVQDFVENLSKAALLMCRHRHGDVLEVQDAQLIAGLLFLFIYSLRLIFFELLPHQSRKKL